MVAVFPLARHFHFSTGPLVPLGWLEAHRVGMHQAAFELASVQQEVSAVSPSLQPIVPAPTLHECCRISTGKGDQPIRYSGA